MEPSALPAFSAPSGVSSAPSFAASAADTAAIAFAPVSKPTTSAATGIGNFLGNFPGDFLVMSFPSSRSERELERGRDVVAIVYVVPASGSAEVGPRHVDFPFRLKVRGGGERESVPALHEVAAGTGRRAFHVVRPDEARHHVPCAHEAGVLEP